MLSEMEVTSYFAVSDYLVLMSYNLLHVINQLVLWAGH